MNFLYLEFTRFDGASQEKIMTYTNAEIALSDLPKHSLVEYSNLSPLYPRINAAITLVFFCGLLASFEVVALFADFPSFVILLGSSLGFFLTLVLTSYSWLAAKNRRFAVRHHDVLYESGLFWRKQMIQPLRRIQHVEVTRGPVDKRYGLAKVQLFSSGSAAATFVIPALPLAQAEQLRDFALTNREET